MCQTLDLITSHYVHVLVLTDVSLCSSVMSGVRRAFMLQTDRPVQRFLFLETRLFLLWCLRNMSLLRREPYGWLNFRNIVAPLSCTNNFNTIIVWTFVCMNKYDKHFLTSFPTKAKDVFVLLVLNLGKQNLFHIVVWWIMSHHIQIFPNAFVTFEKTNCSRNQRCF